jgi:hypothetical protein
MSNGIWNDNSVQFPRLLAEVLAVGLTPEQYAQLGESMDLSTAEIDEVFERAECEFSSIKGDHGECPYLEKEWHERCKR